MIHIRFIFIKITMIINYGFREYLVVIKMLRINVLLLTITNKIINISVKNNNYSF